MATKPREGELFYVDEHGNKQDRELHEDMDRLLPERPLTPPDQHKG
jgi:hypothetical protein